MSTKTIMVIRHAEKPDGTGLECGVDEDGKADPNSLTPRGWSRAGALAALLAPDFPLKNETLPRPTAVYASAPPGNLRIDTITTPQPSRRPLQTISLLATKLRVKPVVAFGRGQEQKMVASVKTAGGVALVCWQHEDIPMIAAEISGLRSPAARLKWPASRFDVVWVFESPDGTGDWTFRQVCQRLLSGDSRRLIA